MSRNKRILITGCTTGIGLEVVRGLAEKPFDFILIGRDEDKLITLKDEIAKKSGSSSRIDYFVCDFENLTHVAAMSKLIGESYRDLDIVVNNAGIWEVKRRADQHNWEMTWVVNYFAPFIMTYNLFPLLRRTARSTKDVRIINVASNAHRFGKIEFPLAQKFFLRKTYGSTKLANILNAFYLARLIKDEGITVNAVHPGVVATELWRNLPKVISTVAKKFMRTPEKGAETILQLALVPELKTTGEYWEDLHVGTPSAITRDEELQKRFFGETKKLIREYLIS